MITDFHTHIFPEKIAAKVVAKLAKAANAKHYTDGSMDSLRRSMEQANVGQSIVLPVVTDPHQHTTINNAALHINEFSHETGIVSFGGIHPDNTNYRQIIRNLASNGIKGIKLHPVYQGYAFDDIKNLRIIDCASENGLVISVHAGLDVGIPGQDLVNPKHTLSVIKQVKPEKLVMAHMGGWFQWDMVEELLIGQNVYLDTSFALTKLCHLDGTEEPMMNHQQFQRLVQKHGADRIIMGSDSPWSSQQESIDVIQKLLTAEDANKVLEKNAASLLV